MIEKNECSERDDRMLVPFCTLYTQSFLLFWHLLSSSPAASVLYIRIVYIWHEYPFPLPIRFSTLKSRFYVPLSNFQMPFKSLCCWSCNGAVMYWKRFFNLINFKRMKSMWLALQVISVICGISDIRIFLMCIAIILLIKVLPNPQQ